MWGIDRMTMQIRPNRVTWPRCCLWRWRNVLNKHRVRYGHFERPWADQRVPGGLPERIAAADERFAHRCRRSRYGGAGGRSQPAVPVYIEQLRLRRGGIRHRATASCIRRIPTTSAQLMPARGHRLRRVPVRHLACQNSNARSCIRLPIRARVGLPSSPSIRTILWERRYASATCRQKPHGHLRLLPRPHLRYRPGKFAVKTPHLLGFAENTSTGALTPLPGVTINPGNVPSTGFTSGPNPGGILGDASGTHQRLRRQDQ